MEQRLIPRMWFNASENTQPCTYYCWQRIGKGWLLDVETRNEADAITNQEFVHLSCFERRHNAQGGEYAEHHG